MKNVNKLEVVHSSIKLQLRTTQLTSIRRTYLYEKQQMVKELLQYQKNLR